MLMATGYVREGFADPLKKMLEPVFRNLGLNHREYLWGSKKATPIAALGGVTAREMLQTLGTNWGRTIHPDFWVLQMRGVLAGHGLMGFQYEGVPILVDSAFGNFFLSPVVIDDMRFSNEFDLVKRLGGVTIRITRGESPGLQHKSESQLEGHHFDFYLPNHGTRDELKDAIVGILTHLGKNPPSPTIN